MIDIESISSCPLLFKETILRKLRSDPEMGLFFVSKIIFNLAKQRTEFCGSTH